MTKKPESKPTPLDTIIGANFARMRKEKGLTQMQVAEAFNCDQSLISPLERGLKPWGSRWLYEATLLLNIDAVELLGGIKKDKLLEQVAKSINAEIGIANEIKTKEK